MIFTHNHNDCTIIKLITCKAKLIKFLLQLESFHQTGGQPTSHLITSRLYADDTLLGCGHNRMWTIQTPRKYNSVV
ncbi:hypothetical protein EB796_002105 [Bugula neritina]|uniref:Uncharacterized protein n=1 Tax=Bugula neritina TaxID=10212 RepID=A0A7J7KN62_BUGNE|nr:hypothetical protein EB796_002105 [Bugula neritina]